MKKNVLLSVYDIPGSASEKRSSRRISGGFYLTWTLGVISTTILFISLLAIVHGCDPAASTSEKIVCDGQTLVPDQMSLVNLKYRNGHYLYTESDTIRVNVSGRQSSDFSYAILNGLGQTLANGNLKACDQSLDKDWEELYIPFPVGLAQGEYKLVFFNDRIQDTNSKVNGRSSYAILVE